MRITYANKRVEKYFTDYTQLQRKLDPSWVRTIKKQMDSFRAAECFGDFLKLGLWRPEQLEGNKKQWSIRVSGNVRLIFEPNETGDAIRISQEIEIEGVVDYHGRSETWYIP